MKCYTEFQCYITGSLRRQMFFGYLFLIVRPLSYYSGSLELVLPIVIKYFAAIDTGAANIYIVDTKFYQEHTSLSRQLSSASKSFRTSFDSDHKTHLNYITVQEEQHNTNCEIYIPTVSVFFIFSVLI